MALKLLAGSVLADRYRLSHRLGEGGMGQVWSAVHVVTGRRVAIKRLLLAGYHDEEDEASGREALARFILEAQAACAVDHPNVVEVLDFIEPVGEPPVLVMELLQGETLAAKLGRDYALDLEQVAHTMLSVVSAVGTAHSLGIIHRDLKPANVFLSERGAARSVAKVLDFGIAKWIAEAPDGSGLRTQTGSTLGTPCYMAPEQAIGERFINHAADIWSLGVILYECLAGARPVDGENPAQMVVRLLSTGIMPIERVVPRLPKDVSGLIGRMLTRDPARRPADLREVFDVLRRHTNSHAPEFTAPLLRSSAEPQSHERPASSLPPEVAWAPSTKPEASAPPTPAAAKVGIRAGVRHRRSVLLASFVLMALVGAVLSTWMLRKAVRPPPAKVASGSFARDAQPSGQPAAALPPAPDTNRDAAPAPIPSLSPGALRVPPKAHGTVRHRAASSETRAAGTASVSPGAPSGASCERSRDCASRLCAAFVCE